MSPIQILAHMPTADSFSTGSKHISNINPYHGKFEGNIKLHHITPEFQAQRIASLDNSWSSSPTDFPSDARSLAPGWACIINYLYLSIYLIFFGEQKQNHMIITTIYPILFQMNKIVST